MKMYQMRSPVALYDLKVARISKSETFVGLKIWGGRSSIMTLVVHEVSVHTQSPFIWILSSLARSW